MSFTLTSTAEKTSTIYLSPSKRPRFFPSETAHRTLSTKELYSWTFSAESIALCTIRDALTMRANTTDSLDFYWLGRVPCRSVKLVGMIVGIQVYEKRIIYTIDDGTSVMDCNHLHKLPKQHPLSKYDRPKEAPPPPVALEPIAIIGQLVEVVGRVRSVHESRAIMVDHIEVCSSPNDELLHTIAVRKLHRESYSLTEPFVPPARTQRSIFDTPIKKNIAPVRNDPIPSPSIAQSSPPSSVTSSPTKFSPVKYHDPVPKSPPKLRHPSRLHTHDLTENTFRIYVKHYMDHAPAYHESTSSEYDSDTDTEIAQMPSTPTKRSRITYSDSTPRQSAGRSGVESTPRASTSKLPSGGPAPPTDLIPSHAGFTLSYLRRVPELSILASRVIQAVGRRRQREDRKKLRESGATTSSSSRTHPKTSSSSTAPILPPDKVMGKMKRLFQWAVIQLLKEGCIILWDGPVRRCPETSMVMDASRLWKTQTNASSTSLLTDNTTFSYSSNTYVASQDEPDTGVLSDPQPNEESYIPLTPSYLAPHVERAVQVLVDHYAEIRKPYMGATKEGIVSVLRKDDRWRYIGTWSVDDALGWLKDEGRVWHLGKGRWDLTM